jgi:hypothetical protein
VIKLSITKKVILNGVLSLRYGWNELPEEKFREFIEHDLE